jgi:hypothetical protein
MTIQVNVQPIDEQNFLKRNALLCLLLGLFFSSDLIYTVFQQQISAVPLLKYSLMLFGFFIFIAMLVMLVRTMDSANKITKETFYYGNFQDEYLNYINAKGYKYAFNFALFYLLSTYYITSVWGNDLASIINISELSKFSAGIVFISYALPVLYMLNGTDDE